ncbi:MAG TPA: M28 family peptidase [Gemmatimonadales bacterium]|nr:M28 family peptidase [Gemmatimonadales bacterium]
MSARRIFPGLTALMALTVSLEAQQMGTATHEVVRAAPPPVLPIDDIRFLSDDRLAGRMTGSPGADTAAAYLSRRFQAVGLQQSAGGWFQTFPISRDAPAAQIAHVGGLTGRNVIGVLPGHDPVLRNEAIIVGAHYDHLGLGGFGSLDPDSNGKVHNGADDNASGAAMLIEIAQRLAAAPPARTVVFIAFSGEELGLLGSAYYVKQPVYPLSTTLAMINLDMVGRLRQKRLIVYGSRSAREFPKLLDSLNWYAGFDLKAQGDGYGPSDQSSFYAAGRPVLHFFTDLHEDYHRTTDDWQKINVEGFEKVAAFVTGVVTALANRPGPLTLMPAATQISASDATGPPMPGYGAYLGTVPDMTDNPGGVRLLGVRAGSPAEKAGLRGDDIITRIGDMSVPDLEAMTEALRRHHPGDTVSVVVRRGTQTTTLQAVLGERGG